MKTIAAIAFLGTTLAVRLSADSETPELDAVRDKTAADFSEGELKCIKEAVRAGLVEEGVSGDDLERIDEKWTKAALEDGATLGDGVDALWEMAEEADYTPQEATDVIEKMFRRAHKCADKQKEREASGDGADGQGDKDLEELLKMKKKDVPKEGLECMGEAVEGVLRDAGVDEATAKGVVEVLGSADDDNTVQDGVDWMRTVSDEKGVSKCDQDEALAEMWERAKKCYEEKTGGDDKDGDDGLASQ